LIQELVGPRVYLQESEFRAILRNEPRCWATAGGFMATPLDACNATLQLAQEVMAAQCIHPNSKVLGSPLLSYNSHRAEICNLL